MAIEKTYLYNSNSVTANANICNYLLENAVPKYFARVENVSNAIRCYKTESNSSLFLEIKHSSNGYLATIKSQTINIGARNSDTATNSARITYAYKCENAISFCVTSTTNDEMNTTIKLTITKDSGRNTAVICLDGTTITTAENAYNSVYTANTDSVLLSFRQCVNANNNYGFSGKIPYPVGDSGNFTPDVFMAPFVQYSGDCVVDFDGVKYLSNGLWFVRDYEEEET